MFQADRRHCGGDRIDDTRRVESAAHPHFQDGDVDVRPAEVPEAHGRERLEGGEWVALDGSVDEERPHPFDELDDGGLRDPSPVDADPFAQVVEVRRGVQPHPVARLAEDRLGHAGGAALAVRAGDLDEFDVLVGVAEVG